MPEKIRVAIAGVGNCASSLIQGISFYQQSAKDNGHGAETIGLMHEDLGGYRPSDIEVVAAFDIDTRKVGRPLREAVMAKPNCTKMFCPDFEANGCTVHMGELLDGVSEHLCDYPEERRFVVANKPAADVERILADSGAEILLNYLPVGSQLATEFYAQCCLNRGRQPDQLHPGLHRFE